MVLDSNPKNYFSEVEQMAFEPSNMPPGIETSPDKMLQVCVCVCVCVCVHGEGGILKLSLKGHSWRMSMHENLQGYVSTREGSLNGISALHVCA